MPDDRWNTYDEADRREQRRRRRIESSGSGGDAWAFGWSPLWGITYGPIPIGLILGVGVIVALAVTGRLN